MLANDEELVQQLRGVRALFGNILQADEAWILDSRLATVTLRMNRQSKNAQRIAEQLAEHPRVLRMYYPSLFDVPSSSGSAMRSATSRARSSRSRSRAASAARSSSCAG